MQILKELKIYTWKFVSYVSVPVLDALLEKMNNKAERSAMKRNQVILKVENEPITGKNI